MRNISKGKSLSVDIFLSKKDTLVTLEQTMINKCQDTIFFRPLVFLPYSKKFTLPYYSSNVLEINGGTLSHSYYDYGISLDFVPTHYYVLLPLDTFKNTEYVSTNIIDYCDTIQYLNISLSYIIFDKKLKNNKHFNQRVNFSYSTINIYNKKEIHLNIGTVYWYSEYVSFRLPFNF